jgi:kynurenine formamidase
MLINQQHHHSLAIGITFEELHGKYFINSTPSKDMLFTVNSNYLEKTKQGCNVSEITFIPHCHGTHTESTAHIDDLGITIDNLHPPLGVPCKLVSICSKRFGETDDTYPVHVNECEHVIDRLELETKLSNTPQDKLQALILRTLPNDISKKYRIYKYLNTYPFFTTEAINYIRNLGVLHLLVDIPSIDRLEDNGKLSNHRIFWSCKKKIETKKVKYRQTATITELIYAPSDLLDGFYCLFLCYPMLKTDAVPSWPLLVKSK